MQQKKQGWFFEELEGSTNKDLEIQKKMVSSVLTLRYNPTLQPYLPKKNWTDFTEQNSLKLDEIETSILESIQSYFSEKPDNIAIALSGGVDSTLVLTLLKNVLPDVPIEAFSIKFANSLDETIQAKKIADHFNVNHNVIYLENYLSELPKAISIIEMPLWDLHWYYVVKNASQYSKFLASGDGGDELFGGYTFRYKKFLSLITPESSPQEKINAYLDCHERDRVPDQEKVFGYKTDFSWENIYSLLLPFFDNPLPPLSQVFLADYNGKLLYNFFPVNSKLHNYFNVKSISPFLNPKVISQSNHIPIVDKYNRQTNVGKLQLRALLKKYGTDVFVSNEKLGFNVNTLNLWESFGHKICTEYLSDSRAAKDGWISQNWITNYLHKDNLDVKYVNKFIGLLAFEIWYRLFITKEMSSKEILS